MAKKKWMVGGVAALVVVAAVGLRAMRGPDSKGVKFQTAEVTRGPLTSKVTATGTLSALVTVQVGSQVSGRIQELFADYNSKVKKGELIARIDPQLFQAAEEQARANYLAAQSNLKKAEVMAEDARRQFERQKGLFERKLIAQADLDTSEANHNSARASVEASRGAVLQTKAAYNQAQVNLAYTRILSPIDGVVISRNVDVGQTVAAQLQAPTLFTIAEDLTRMQVDTNVAEADIGRLEPGMEATFTVDAFPNAPFKGTIRQIRNAPITVQNVVTYDAVIDVSNPDLKLKPGMTANVTIVSAKADDVLRVPNAAFRFRPTPEQLAAASGAGDEKAAAGNGRARAGGENGKPAAGQKQLWVLRDEKPVSVVITPGISDGTLTEIAAGDVKQGERVITEASGGAAASGTPRPPGMMGPPAGGGRGGPRMF